MEHLFQKTLNYQGIIRLFRESTVLVLLFVFHTTWRPKIALFSFKLPSNISTAFSINTQRRKTDVVKTHTHTNINSMTTHSRLLCVLLHQAGLVAFVLELFLCVLEGGIWPYYPTTATNRQWHTKCSRFLCCNKSDLEMCKHAFLYKNWFCPTSACFPSRRPLGLYPRN